MASLVTQVKSKLFIHSAQKSLHQLDGAYASLMRGRSDDFEDLRAYEFGDQIRDIDWRATAKQGEPLVKRFRATRMHTVLFVVDTGLGMNALAHDESPKRDLAVLVVGALGYLTVRHGDDIALVYGDADRVRRLAPARSDAALENMLRTIVSAATESTSPSARDELFRYVARTTTRRMIVVVITDQEPISAESEKVLRRLRVQHDVLWVTLNDADPVLASPGRIERADVYSQWGIPDFVHGDPLVLNELRIQAEEEAQRLEVVLKSLEVTHGVIDSQSDAVPTLLAMLNRRLRVRSR